MTNPSIRAAGQRQDEEASVGRLPRRVQSSPGKQASSRIRAFRYTEADYEARATVCGAVVPPVQTSVERLRLDDLILRRTKGAQMKMYFAEQDGEVAGFGRWYHDPGMFHPRQVFLELAVRPEHGGRGIGSRLFEAVVRNCRETRRPVLMRCSCYENQDRTLRFLRMRGFGIQASTRTSFLNVLTADLDRHVDVGRRVLSCGARLATLADARGSHELEGWLRGIYDLESAIARDVPAAGSLTMEDFEIWQYRILGAGFFESGIHLALDGDLVVGVSVLFRQQESGTLTTGTTGVLRSHRRRGIGLALKSRATATASVLGATRIVTQNGASNLPMISLNERVGFEKGPALLELYRSA